jgi:hypothetical protein
MDVCCASDISAFRQHVTIYLPSFIKIGSTTGKLIEGIHRQYGDHIFLCFQNKGSRLKVELKYYN